MQTRGVGKAVIAVAAVTWVVAIVFGGSALLRYSATGGAASPAPATWPSASRLARAEGDTLVMFAHPFCACTKASLAELDRLLTQGHMSATVVFLDPRTDDQDWRGSGLVERARGMANVSVVFDEGGEEAARFGAATSGHVVLYDAAGKLRYAGGVTQARGHEGWAAGQRALLTILGGAEPESTHAPTYGCSLTGPQEPEFADKGKREK